MDFWKRPGDELPPNGSRLIVIIDYSRSEYGKRNRRTYHETKRFMTFAEYSEVFWNVDITQIASETFEIPGVLVLSELNFEKLYTQNEAVYEIKKIIVNEVLTIKAWWKIPDTEYSGN